MIIYTSQYNPFPTPNSPEQSSLKTKKPNPIIFFSLSPNVNYTNMPGKRLRLVRSSTSFDDMNVFNEPLPPPKLRTKMKPPRYPTKILTEDDDVPQSAIMTLPSPSMKENDQGHTGNFLDSCYYCKKILDENDNIYMYRYVSAIVIASLRVTYSFRIYLSSSLAK